MNNNKGDIMDSNSKIIVRMLEITAAHKEMAKDNGSSKWASQDDAKLVWGTTIGGWHRHWHWKSMADADFADEGRRAAEEMRADALVMLAKADAADAIAEAIERGIAYDAECEE